MTVLKLREENERNETYMKRNISREAFGLINGAKKKYIEEGAS